MFCLARAGDETHHDLTLGEWPGPGSHVAEDRRRGDPGVAPVHEYCTLLAVTPGGIPALRGFIGWIVITARLKATGEPRPQLSSTVKLQVRVGGCIGRAQGGQNKGLGADDNDDRNGPADGGDAGCGADPTFRKTGGRGQRVQAETRRETKTTSDECG